MLIEMVNADTGETMYTIQKATTVPRRSSKLMIQGKRWKIVDEGWFYGVGQKANPIVVLRLKPYDD